MSTATQETPVKQENKNLDAFGNRPGSKLSRINCVLLKAQKPLSMSEIKERAGETQTFYDHVNALIKRGLVEKDSEGKYRVVAPKKPRKKGKGKKPAKSPLETAPEKGKE